MKELKSLTLSIVKPMDEELLLKVLGGGNQIGNDQDKLSKECGAINYTDKCGKCDKCAFICL